MQTDQVTKRKEKYQNNYQNSNIVKYDAPVIEPKAVDNLKESEMTKHSKMARIVYKILGYKNP